MRFRGPVLTLLAVAVLAGLILMVNIRTATETATQATIPQVTTQVPAAGQPPAGTRPPAEAQSPAGPQPPADVPDPTPPAAGDQTAYTGSTSGNEATIAIETQGDQVAAYLCDGNQIEAWLEGTITDGQLNLQGNDAASATGVVDGDTISGSVRVQGNEWEYTAQRVESPAGLYEGRGEVAGEPARIGWIVRPDGSQTGIAKIGGTTGPAPELDPGQLTGVEVNGSTIVPRPVAGADQVVGSPPKAGG